MAGYQTIGETTKSAAAFEEEERVVVGTGYQSGPAYPAVSEERERESSGFPSLYTAPFDLSTDSSFGERVKLVFESARPWGEFFDLNNFKLPKMSEIHERITHNSVVFFSNYVIACALELPFLALIHPLGVLSLVGFLCLASWFYGSRGNDIRVTDTVVINQTSKRVLLGVAFVLAFFVFNASAAFWGEFWFLLLFAGPHILLFSPSIETV